MQARERRIRNAIVKYLELKGWDGVEPFLENFVMGRDGDSIILLRFSVWETELMAMAESRVSPRRSSAFQRALSVYLSDPKLGIPGKLRFDQVDCSINNDRSELHIYHTRNATVAREEIYGD